MGSPEQRWIVTVDLSGEAGDPTPYSGSGDNGGATFRTSYGTSYQGIGPSPDDARASATGARESALLDLKEVLDRLEDTTAGAVDAELVREVRRLLGAERVPPLPQVSRDMLTEWITELRHALGEAGP